MTIPRPLPSSKFTHPTLAVYAIMKLARRVHGGREDRVNNQSETPFDSIESSHEYIVMLSDAIAEALADVEADIADAQTDHAARRKEALQLVSFNLSKLHSHINSSRRILNDLRTLRRLLLEERILVRRAGQVG